MNTEVTFTLTSDQAELLSVALHCHTMNLFSLDLLDNAKQIRKLSAAVRLARFGTESFN
jgi:hypothetical protein